MPTQKSRAEYMAARRQAAKETLLGKVPGQPEVATLKPQDILAVQMDARRTEITSDMGPDLMTDRERGLPRSNYHGDWVPTIQRMSSRQIDKILSHPAVKTPGREKK